MQTIIEEYYSHTAGIATVNYFLINQLVGTSICPAVAAIPSDPFTTMTTTFNRRDFIRGTGASLATLIVSGTALSQLPVTVGPFDKAPTPAADRLGSLVVEDFIPFIGENLRAQTSDGRGVQLKLILAEDSGVSSKWRSRYVGPSYSLTFEAPRKSNLPQDVYAFRHYHLGNFSLLLVPVGLTGRRFEALINRTQE